MVEKRFSLWQILIVLTILAVGFGLGVLYARNFFLTREVVDLREKNIVAVELGKISRIAERLEIRSRLVKEILENAPVDQKQLTEEANALTEDYDLFFKTEEQGKANVKRVIGHITPYVISVSKLKVDTSEVFQVLEASQPYLLEGGRLRAEKN